MIIFIAITLSLLGGVYVGARYSEKLKAIWYSISG